jgi:DNA-directed RNA polymerase subunit M/transcription elongation factor TFIIS
MHFCKNCGNMYYVRLLTEDSDKLIYYCRKCDNKDDKIMNDDDICVSKLHVKNVSQTYKNIINEYTKLDPTLPRITTINCPNIDCDSNKEPGDNKKKPKEIIYLRYDDQNMKFVYLCANCDKIWLNSKN